ncbi:hypothetical protein NVT85_08285 [Acinetobacter radioresistens]|uniref:hypothetical protein n=1 Tax=Acinetobacter radioresistens TaxID=40216 RepID=UPI002245DF97|nr:hypothetical protein [Acinetobacter radioresistens]MCX0336754.1 hypothetical protein [Acinetobacter radioresistens]
MITIQKINSLESGDTGLGQYHISEAGAALAHIPEFKAFYDAEVYTAGARRIMNRVNGQYSELGGTFNLVGGEKPYLNKTIVAGNTVTHLGDYDINPNEWTFFFVAKPIPTNNTQLVFRFVRTLNQSALNTIYLALSSTTKTLSVYREFGGGTPRTSYATETGQELANLAHPSLVIFSFSTEKGVEIRINGKKVANTLTEGGKTPVTEGIAKDQWDWFRNASGDYYAWGGLNIDLTRVVNTEYLEALESYFMNKYGISRMN